MADFKRDSGRGDRNERSFSRGSRDRDSGRSFGGDRRGGFGGDRDSRSDDGDRRSSGRSFGGGGRSFGGDRRGGFGGGRDRRDGPKEMFKVVCDACGVDCEVPFKPTEGKPVLCSSCFEKKQKGGSSNQANYEKEFDTLNAKLDLILKEILTLKKECPKKEEISEVKEAKVSKTEEKDEKPAKKAVKKTVKKK